MTTKVRFLSSLIVSAIVLAGGVAKAQAPASSALVVTGAAFTNSVRTGGGEVHCGPRNLDPRSLADGQLASKVDLDAQFTCDKLLPNSVAVRSTDYRLVSGPGEAGCFEQASAEYECAAP